MAETAKSKLQKRLKPFFQLNPGAKLEQKGKKDLIVNPWNDQTVAIEVSLDNKRLLDALNKLLLPPPLVAMWHTDTKDLEIIYTMFVVDSAYYSRSFDFHFRGKTYKCEFAKSSDRLLSIVEGFSPAGQPSPSLFRNLDHFKYSLDLRKSKFAKGLIGQPTCFWIREIEWDEELAVDLCRHLNFYMHLYDRETPLIIIVKPPKGEQEPIRKIQYLFDAFPGIISATTLEPYLLILFESALVAKDPISEFLYYYQIIEYGAFYYLDSRIKSEINQIITQPHTPAQPQSAVKQIIDVVDKSRMEEVPRINAVVKQKVEPKLIWKEIEPNKSFFSNPVQFDGGFTVDPLINSDWQINDFIVAWHPKLAETFRKIRNALVHSKGMPEVIAPVEANYPKLEPWVGPLSVAAMQVMLLHNV